jgi:hypothetical protein
MDFDIKEDHNFDGKTHEALMVEDQKKHVGNLSKESSNANLEETGPVWEFNISEEPTGK